jgi:hypothetical protein
MAAACTGYGYSAGGDMLRDFLRRLTRPGPRPRQRRRSRAAGCLLWLVVLVVVLIVVALLFGGFRKGTPAGGAGAPAPVSIKTMINGSAPPGAAPPPAPAGPARQHRPGKPVTMSRVPAAAPWWL